MSKVMLGGAMMTIEQLAPQGKQGSRKGGKEEKRKARKQHSNTADNKYEGNKNSEGGKESDLGGEALSNRGSVSFEGVR